LLGSVGPFQAQAALGFRVKRKECYSVAILNLARLNKKKNKKQKTKNTTQNQNKPENKRVLKYTLV